MKGNVLETKEMDWANCVKENLFLMKKINNQKKWELDLVYSVI